MSDINAEITEDSGRQAFDPLTWRPGHLYTILKGKVYGEACIYSGHNNHSAQVAGYKDVFDVIMSDSDHSRQPLFIMHLVQTMPQGHRQILLDDMAREYASVDGWMDYVDQENMES